jgi:hypothetical protein
LYADFASEDVANYSNGSQNLTIIVLSLVQKSLQMITSIRDLVASGELSDGFSYDEYILKAAVISLDIKEGDPSLGKSVGAYYSIWVFYCSGKRSHR